MRLQFSPRNRVCNKIFFRCVSEAWEHRGADRRESGDNNKRKEKKRKKERKTKKTVILKMNVEGITSSLTTTTERVIECIYRLSTPCPCLSLPPHTITEPPSSVKISFYIRNYSVLYIPMYYIASRLIYIATTVCSDRETKAFPHADWDDIGNAEHTSIHYNKKNTWKRLPLLRIYILYKQYCTI